MTVYAVQEQLTFDPQIGMNVPRFSTITKAENFGTLVYVHSPSAHPFDMPTVVANCHAALENFCDSDFLILVGNPILLAVTACVAAERNNGKVKFLQWSRKNEQYLIVSSLMY